MNRFGALAWPWTGLLIFLALMAQELVLRMSASPTDLSVVAWRIFAMTLGVASLALLVMPDWRKSMLLGALACAGLIGYALYAQYVLNLEPCPLCIFQRVAMIVCGVIFLLGALHNPGRVGAVVYSLLIVLAAGVGAAVAARQVWLQSLPPDKVPACGPGLSYMIETLPFTDMLATVLKGSGECAKIDWRFLDLTMPAWTLVLFLTMIAAAIALTRRG